MANKRMNHKNNNHSQQNHLEVFCHRCIPHSKGGGIFFFFSICRPGATLHGMVKWFRIVVRFCNAVVTSTIWIKNLQNILFMKKNCTTGSTHLSGSHLIISHTTFKGIVSWDWDRLEWIVNERSKELRIAGAYLYCFLMPFSCFNF